MPVTRTAKRALVRSQRKHIINLRQTRRLKDAINEFRSKPTKKLLGVAYSLIDRSAKQNLMHPNKAARLKSQLAEQMSS